MNSSKNALVEKFLSTGYQIFDIKKKKELDNLRLYVYEISTRILNLENQKTPNIDQFFKNFHHYVKNENLNEFKIKLINEYCKNKKINNFIYELSKNYVEILVGKEICMQRIINLIISMPKDVNGGMAIHNDTWGGNSPYEIILWIPLITCTKTMSLFLVPQDKTRQALSKIKASTKVSEIEDLVKNDKIYPTIKYGQALLLSSTNLHGSSTNLEAETRWSFNVRFKNMYTPFGTKGFLETFLPVELVLNEEI